MQHWQLFAQYYMASSGIATGISCGVFLANIYLSEFDDEMFKLFRPRFSNFFRLVDDVVTSSDV